MTADHLSQQIEAAQRRLEIWREQADTAAGPGPFGIARAEGTGRHTGRVEGDGQGIERPEPGIGRRSFEHGNRVGRICSFDDRRTLDARVCAGRRRHAPRGEPGLARFCAGESARRQERRRRGQLFGRVRCRPGARRRVGALVCRRHPGGDAG